MEIKVGFWGKTKKDRDSTTPVKSLFLKYFRCTGGATRTPDTWFWRPVLYQLSYTRIPELNTPFALASANIIIHSKLPKLSKIYFRKYIFNQKSYKMQHYRAA